MTRKLIAIVLAVSAILGVWGETEYANGYTWTYYLNNDEAVIHGSYGGSGTYLPAISPKPTGVVTIPNVLGGKLVTCIERYAFVGCSGLTGVTIPNSVTSIGDGVFRGCSCLVNVKIPDRVMSIGWGAFYGCNEMTNLNIPDSVTHIGNDAFEGCYSLNFDTLTIPGVKLFDRWVVGFTDGLPGVLDLSGIRGVCDYAFYGCTGLTSVTIPEGVRNLGGFSFCDCSSLETVAIPNSVTNIERYTFGSCDSLLSISVGSDNSRYRSINGLLLSKDGKILVQGVNGDVEVPNGVTNIAEYAFEGCSGLTSIKMPDSITRIGSYAFEGCSGLANIAIPNRVTEIGWGVFSDCSGLTGVNIPYGVTSIETYAFAGCSSLAAITIPDSVKSVDTRAFEDCSEILFDTITISGVKLVDGWVVGYMDPLSGALDLTGARGVGDDAFSGCSGITRLVIPDDIVNISHSAFSGCSGLTSVTIPQYVCDQKLSNIFRDSYRTITEVTLSANVTNVVGYYSGSCYCGPPFDGCAALEKIMVSPDNQHYKFTGGLLLTKDGRKIVIVPEGREYVFIPDSVTSVPADVFSNCTKLGRDMDGNGIESIDGWVIGCDEERLPRSLVLKGYRGIADGVFRSCNRLASVTIGEGIKAVGRDVFSCCVNLSSLAIPASVTVIGDNAFGCSVNLKTISLASGNANYKYSGNLLISADNTQLVAVSRNATTADIPDGVTSIPEAFFAGCSKLTSINIPASVEEIVCDEYGAFWYLDWVDDDNYVVRGCPALKSITVADGNSYYRSENGYLLGLDAYGDYEGWGLCAVPQAMTSVAIPEGVTWIRWGAFYGCEKVTSIALPSSLVEVSHDWDWGGDPFRPCGSLQSFSVSEGNGRFVSADGMLATKEGELIVVPRGLGSQKTITIPTGIRRIGEDAFYGFYKLSSILIPEGVEEIGCDAFESCTSLASVTFPQSLKTIESYAFYGCPLKSVSIPDGVTQIGQEAFRDLKSRDVNTIPGLILVDGWVVGVADTLWEDYNNPTEYLNDALQSSRVRGIAAGAFANCGELLYLSIPECVKHVPEYLFNGCGPKLKRVEMPEGVESIGRYAFSNCEMMDISIPESVKRVGVGAFRGDSIDKDTISGLGLVDGWIVQDVGIATLLAEDASFDGEWTISGEVGIRGIADRAFRNMSNCLPEEGVEGVTSLVIGDGVVSIGAEAFENCRDLTNVYVSTSVEYIGEYAFDGCEKLQTAFLPDTLRGKIPQTAFPQSVKIFYCREDGTINDAHLIRLDANGGELDGQSAIVEIEDGATVGALPNPVRSGYRFIGWCTAVIGGAPITDEMAITDNQTFYAQWVDSSCWLKINVADFYETDGDGTFELEMANLIDSATTPKVTVKGLPAGLKYDSKTMGISGKATKPGVYKVAVSATNATVKNPVTAEFTINVPNFTTLMFEAAGLDTDGKYVLMAGVVPENINAVIVAIVDGGWNLAVSGLPSGVKYDAKNNKNKKIIGIATKEGLYTVTFTATKGSGKTAEKQVATATFEVVFPTLTLEMAAWKGESVSGTVTGGGKYPLDKKVNLKATPAKGCVFAGWRDVDGAIVTQTASYSYVTSDDDVTLTAVFATTEEDKASITLKVDGEEMSYSSDGSPTTAYTNYCGVAVDWPIEADALSAATVKVSGLPSGVKLVQDKKTGAYSFVGAPSAASKADKNTGVLKPNFVKLTVSTAGKSSKIYAFNWTILPLPEWAVGTFNGHAGRVTLPEGGEGCGMVTLTVDAKGKISGKLIDADGAWTLSAAAYERVERLEQGNLEGLDNLENQGNLDDLVFLATVIGKNGKRAITNEVTVASKELAAAVAGQPPYRRGVVSGWAASEPPVEWTAWQNLWKTEPWKNDAKEYAKAPKLTVGEIELKFGASGAVTAKFGKYACSTVLIPAEDGTFHVFCYFPPMAGTFDGYAIELLLGWDGAAFQNVVTNGEGV